MEENQQRMQAGALLLFMNRKSLESFAPNLPGMKAALSNPLGIFHANSLKFLPIA
jgi:hypothetical protein